MTVRVDKNAVYGVLQGEAVFSSAVLPSYILATDFIDENGCTAVIAHNNSRQEGLLFHVDGIRSPAEVLAIVQGKDQGGKTYTLTFVTLDLSSANAHLHRMVELAGEAGFKHRIIKKDKIAINLRSGQLMSLDLRPFFAGRSREAFKDLLESEVNQIIHDPYNKQLAQGPWDYNFIPLRYTDLSVSRGQTP